MDEDDLFALILVLLPLSLLSIGGGTAIIAELEGEVVRGRHWLSSQDFLQLFAVSRAAPGPGVMLATLIGWKMAGWAGAILATLALFLPSSLLFYGVYRASHKHRAKRWHRVLREGLAPIGTGLMIAGVLAIMRISGGGGVPIAITLMAAAVLYRYSSVPPLAIILGGGCFNFILWLCDFAV